MLEIGSVVDVEYGGAPFVGEVVDPLRGEYVRVQFPKVIVGENFIIARLVTVTRQRTQIVLHEGEVPSLQERMFAALKDATVQLTAKRSSADD